MPAITKKERRRPIVESLVIKLNDMPDDERAVFAKDCGTSFGNLQQIAYGWGGLSVSKAKQIVDACDGDIDLGDLFPEFKEIA